MHLEQLEDRLLANTSWYVPEPIRLAGNEVSVRLHDDGAHVTLTDGKNSWQYDSSALWALAIVPADSERGIKIVGENILGGRAEFIKVPPPSRPPAPSSDEAPARREFHLADDQLILSALLALGHSKFRARGSGFNSGL